MVVDDGTVHTAAVTACTAVVTAYIVNAITTYAPTVTTCIAGDTTVYAAAETTCMLAMTAHMPVQLPAQRL